MYPKIFWLDNCNISSDPLISNRAGFILRKKYKYAEKVDLEFMWLHALGMNSNNNVDLVGAADELKRNQGIWAPDSGPCADSERNKICTLSSGAKYYSWANRNKEKGKLLIFC